MGVSIVNENQNFNRNSLISAKIYPLTTTQRLALSLVAGDAGLLVYDTNLGTLFGWTGTAWKPTSQIQIYTLSRPDQLNSTQGGLFKANATGALPTVNPSDANGFQNGNIDPIMSLVAGQITQMTVRFAQSAVAEGTVGANPNIRIAVYRIGASATGTPVNIDIPVGATGVQVSNNLVVTANKQVVFNLPSPVAIGDAEMIGIAFINSSSFSGGNGFLNGVGRLFITFKIE